MSEVRIEEDLTSKIGLALQTVTHLDTLAINQASPSKNIYGFVTMLSMLPQVTRVGLLLYIYFDNVDGALQVFVTSAQHVTQLNPSRLSTLFQTPCHKPML
ncbi:hypothetical protein EON65_28700 [archaeon]|nr:MAG: hypothetical protein EON65_28700 [archaeon]